MAYDADKAREELEKILARASWEVRALARRIADGVSRQAEQTNQSTAQILLQQFRRLNVDPELRRIVGAAVVQSVAAGYGLTPSVSASVRAQATALDQHWDSRGMTLSQQVHGTVGGFRLALDDSLRQSFAQGRSIQQAARAIYDGYQPGRTPTGPFAAIVPAIPARGGNAPAPALPLEIDAAIVEAGKLSPKDWAQLQVLRSRIASYASGLQSAPLRTAYMDLARRLNRIGTESFRKAVYAATEEKARYFADRIARTEAARAWGAAFRDQQMGDDMVVGIRSKTSSAHNIFDICDFHARADLYGMGPGCYPKDRAPSYPYHPHCGCILSPIRKRRPSDPGPRDGGPDVAAGAATLQAMRQHQRNSLLTIAGANTLKVDPASWPRTMRHWSASTADQETAVKAAQQVAKALNPPPNGLEEMLARAVEEEKKIWKNAGFETAVIVRNGEEPVVIKGEAASVRIPRENMPDLYGSVFTHNHPLGWGHPEDSPFREGGSFSDADLRLGMLGGCARMRAVTPVWAYEVDFQGKVVPVPEILQAYADTLIKIKADPKNKPHERSHDICRSLAERFGWSYTREKHGY
jgi:hypothetical protein